LLHLLLIVAQTNDAIKTVRSEKRNKTL